MSRQTATLACLAFAMLIVSLDQYIVVVALPEIGRELGYSSQTLQSVIVRMRWRQPVSCCSAAVPLTCSGGAGSS
jgi:hypothetical protein